MLGRGEGGGRSSRKRMTRFSSVSLLLEDQRGAIDRTLIWISMNEEQPLAASALRDDRRNERGGERERERERERKERPKHKDKEDKGRSLCGE